MPLLFPVANGTSFVQKKSWFRVRVSRVSVKVRANCPSDVAATKLKDVSDFLCLNADSGR